MVAVMKYFAFDHGLFEGEKAVLFFVVIFVGKARLASLETNVEAAGGYSSESVIFLLILTLVDGGGGHSVVSRVCVGGVMEAKRVEEGTDEVVIVVHSFF